LANKPDTTLNEFRGGSYRTYTYLHSTLTHVHRSSQNTNHKARKIGIRKEWSEEGCRLETGNPTKEAGLILPCRSILTSMEETDDMYQ
jgi:hypothetical protein